MLTDFVSTSCRLILRAAQSGKEATSVRCHGPAMRCTGHSDKVRASLGMVHGGNTDSFVAG